MKEIKLFDYQEDMKERIEKALRLHRSVMAQMPTGTGKTVLLASVVESFLREHSNCNVWIVAHRRELVSQIKDTLNKFLLNFSFSNHPVPLSKEGSTSTPSPSSSEGGDVTALRCSEPLRSKVGGPSKVSPDCAGWDRLSIEGDNSAGSTTAVTSSASTALDVVQKELKELGLWKFAGGIMYIMQEVFGMPASRLIVPPNEKYGKFVLNEVLEAGNFGRHDARNRFGRSQLGHNLQRVYRDIRLVRYFPAEALCEPLFRIWHFFWRMKHKK